MGQPLLFDGTKFHNKLLPKKMDLLFEQKICRTSVLITEYHYNEFVNI